MIDRSPRRVASEIEERWVPSVVLVTIALVVAIAAIRNTQWAVGGPVLLGLLGTTAGDDAERDLGRVTDAVERLTRGEYDVDVPTDGDGEIGRLSESVRALADELRERDRTAERRRAFADDLLDAVDDVFYVLDREGYHRRWNESLTRVTGYSDEEIAEMHVLDAFRESDHDAIERTIQDGFETGSGYVRVDYRTRGGRFRPYEFVANRIEAPDGEPLLAGIGRDLSEREGQLRRSRERERQLSTLISNVPGMVYRGRNEPDWPLEFVSEGCRELTGYEPERLAEGGGVSWADDVLRGDDEALWEIVQDALAEREPFQVTYPIETAGGSDAGSPSRGAACSTRTGPSRRSKG